MRYLVLTSTLVVANVMLLCYIMRYISNALLLTVKYCELYYY